MPEVPYDLLDRIRDLEQQVRDLTGRSQIRPAMNQIQAGNVVIGQGGTLRVDDVDGSPLFYVGKLPVNNPDGSEQRGLVVYRDDGTPAIQLRRTTAIVGNPQGIVMTDAHGTTLLAEDVITGGIAYPNIPLLAPADVDASRWPRTTSGAWTTIATSFNIKVQPWMGAYVRTAVDGGTTGEVRILVDGTPWGPTATAGGPTALEYYGATPTGMTGLMQIDIQAQRLSGAGSVYAQCMQLFGRGS
ncbi:hypothetical protein RMN57_13295 [Kitasatospora sp. CM 4170]|uniref:Minor tail protein n=1 Tax=Kitasatospora aburaviensis TaxID=67265 RepID=A0ABW1ER70_9ACTN|nr:hypothetical protein [Kitasatospora sp. CM 4170]WNM45629.1 hypothetical protein RMN57_13295 [Kitasatospora sp. CM 4170]